MPKCWFKILLDKCHLLCTFFPVLSHEHYSVFEHTVLYPAPSAPPFFSAPPPYELTGVISIAVGQVDSEQTRLSLMHSCSHANYVSAINTWSADL